MTLFHNMCDIQSFKIDDTPKRIIDLILTSFRQHCKDPVTEDFVSFKYGQIQVHKADYIFLAFSNKFTRTGKPITTVCGFLLLQHLKPQNEAYIDVVCSSSKGGIGGKLIKQAEHFAKNDLRCSVIKLSALSHVLQYYKKKHSYMETDKPCKLPVPVIKRKGSKSNGYRMTKCLSTS